jgi:hypothetical protein
MVIGNLLDTQNVYLHSLRLPSSKVYNLREADMYNQKGIK